MPSLKIRRDGETRAKIPLSPAVHVIGRDPSLELCLNDLQVSRQHAVIVVDRAGARIRDLGSRNGSFVNGARLPDRCPQVLTAGDTIKLGRSELCYQGPSARKTQPKRGGARSAAGLRRPKPAHAARAPWVPVIAVVASVAAGVLVAFTG